MPADDVIGRVHRYVEQCLLRQMTKEETMHTISVRFQIEPRFTQLVWERLEEENPEFFSRYYHRLMINYQILEFNRLRRQVEQMNQNHQFTSNRSHVSPTQQISTISVQNTRPANGSSVQPSMQGIYVDPSTFAQNGNMGSVRTMNRNIFRTQAEPSMQHLYGTVLDGDTSPAGSSTQASTSIENSPDLEPSDGNNTVDSHGDVEAMSDPESVSSSHQNPSGN